MRRSSFLGALPLVLALGCGTEPPSGHAGTDPTDHGGTGQTGTSPRATELTQPAEISESGDGAIVRPHFDWPARARGRVEGSRTIERTGLPRTERASARYRIAIARHGSEVTLRTSELTVRAPGRDPGEELQGALVATTFLPSSRFTADLDALALVEGERTAEQMRSAVIAATSVELRSSPAFQQIAPMVGGDPEAIRRSATSFLFPIVSLDGLPLERGQLVALRDERQTTAGEQARQSTMTTLLGRGPCFEGDAADACVSVEVRAHYEAHAAEGPAAAGMPTVRSIEGTLRMVLEPTTLLPHRVEAEKVTVFVPPGDVVVAEITETESLRWLFRWERGSIRE